MEEFDEFLKRLKSDDVYFYVAILNSSNPTCNYPIVYALNLECTNNYLLHGYFIYLGDRKIFNLIDNKSDGILISKPGKPIGHNHISHEEFEAKYSKYYEPESPSAGGVKFITDLSEEEFNKQIQ